MKWVATGLLIINVGVFLSIGSQTDYSDEVSIIRPIGVNEQAMLLLGEIEKPPSSIQNPAATQPVVDNDTDIVEDTSTNGVVARGLSAEQDSSRSTELSILPTVNDQETQTPERMYAEQQVTEICFRVGPFGDEPSMEQASAWMNENEITAETVMGNSREIKAIRVFAGPFLQKESLQRYISELKIKQLQFREMNRELEYYVYGDSETGSFISFGYFHQQELASKYLNDLQEIGIQAELEPNYEIVGPLYWLETTVPFDFADYFQSRQWADEKVKTAKIEC
ncbi:MAG: hypothetical protein F4X92_02520 [Gammaproteobacteria bacterium]|nr:hypothetical protein [Gammaproteobacteria bacterium]